MHPPLVSLGSEGLGTSFGARNIRAGIILAVIACTWANCRADTFPWLEDPLPDGTETIGSIAPPAGFTRAAVDSGGYAGWLRALPLKKAGTPARLHDGRRDRDQRFVHRVLDIDTGDRDLQQCADAVIRLRAEYLFLRQDLDAIAFDFTSGDRARFTRWAEGYRPRVRGNEVHWSQRAAADTSYTAFREYLDSVFMYAGTHSLAKEMVAVPRIADIRAGDVFIRGGFPGHVVIVMDVARNRATGQQAVLLAQGFMPAIDIHILNNVRDRPHSPWFLVGENSPLFTNWGWFRASDLKRFRG